MPFDSTNYKIHTDQDAVALATLRATRENIATPRSWCKHNFNNRHGGHCIMGWLHVAYRGNVDRLVADYLMPFVKPGFDTIVEFNDDDKTRKRDVLKVLDRAIVNLENSK